MIRYEEGEEGERGGRVEMQENGTFSPIFL